LPVGRKGRDFFRRRQFNVSGEYVGLTGKGRIEFSEALEVARDLINRFTENHEIDKVFIIYDKVKTVLQQRVVVERLLPVVRTTKKEDEKPDQQASLVHYIYEQPP